MTDILNDPFDPFADAVEETLKGFRSEIAGLRTELSTALTEVRSLKSELETRSAAPTIDVEAIATRAAQLVPAPKDGVDGKPGENGKDGADGKDGERGADGLQGRDGTNGIDGRDGKDGIATPEEIQSLVTSEVARAVADVQVRTFADIYTGTYQVGSTYTRGLLATWGGSLWLSNVQTTKKPGDNNADWTLIVKRGADAKR